MTTTCHIQLQKCLPQNTKTKITDMQGKRIALETMNTNIMDLPPELIEQIFDHLQHRERLEISCICKTWRKIAFSPKFCRKSYLHIRSPAEIEVKLRDGEASKHCRNAVISRYVPDDHRNLLIDYLREAPLESLKIVGGKETVKVISELLAQMQMLQTLHLQLQEVDGEILRISHPTLKKLTLVNMGPLEIDCPNLIAIQSHPPDERHLNSFKCLRKQLQSLTLISINIYTALSDVLWDKLTDLHLTTVPRGNDFVKLLEQMPCLKKITLQDNHSDSTIGKEFGTAKSLSELVLIEMTIDVEFNQCLEQLTLLGSLTLNNVIFTPRRQAERLKSDSVTRFTFIDLLHYPLPKFPNLKSLDLQCGVSKLCDTFRDLCIYYPKLEHLSFGVLPGRIGMFQNESENPKTKLISHLGKLTFLETFHLNRIATVMMDWSTCNESRIQNLRLDGCSIDGATAHQLVQVFKYLRRLFLDHCYLRQPGTDVFELDENCTHGLRSLLPGCKISYYDCHIEELHETCGSRRMDVTLC